MKKAQCRRSIRNREVANVLDQEARYPKISARLKDAEKALYQVGRELNSAQSFIDIALERSRSVAV